MKLRYTALAFGLIIAAGLVGASQLGIGQDKNSKATAAAPKQEVPGELWSVRCNEKDGDVKEEKRGKCEIYQRLVVSESGQRVAEFAIGYPEGGSAARGVIILPLGILLSAGNDAPPTQMLIDEGEPFGFRTRYCDVNGCFAYLNLNDAVLDMLRKGKQVSFLFLDRQGKTIRVNMSLEGIGKALKQIS